MLDKGVPEEGLDQAMAIAGKFMKPGIMAIIGLFSSVIMGTVIAVIIAAIFKRSEPEEPVISE